MSLLAGCAIYWSSKKHVVTLSKTEAEYVAVATCTCLSICVRGLEESCLNNSTFKASMFHEKSKHIDVKFHFDLKEFG